MAEMDSVLANKGFQTTLTYLDRGALTCALYDGIHGNNFIAVHSLQGDGYLVAWHQACDGMGVQEVGCVGIGIDRVSITHIWRVGVSDVEGVKGLQTSSIPLQNDFFRHDVRGFQYRFHYTRKTSKQTNTVSNKTQTCKGSDFPWSHKNWWNSQKLLFEMEMKYWMEITEICCSKCSIHDKQKNIKFALIICFFPPFKQHQTDNQNY